ncbi:cupin domain-containing protein [Kribbella speibonae]|uniref:Cupin domain-containing protein n=1 Tax=Kribbella speibonae TaxID=1572660 RepID=A0A4R0J577_9ACTN|nr:cupin domain-containing protein [Kribbella speibonae]TCC36465.1 cupin domain-containing protein [Kribbella speibonae]
MSSSPSPEIQIVSAGNVTPVILGDTGAMRSKRLIRRDMGSERVSLNFTVTEETTEEYESDYPEHDELIFIVSGVGEIEWEGSEATRVSAGMAIFVPQGCGYRYRVVEGPQEAVIVFGPAYS